LIYSNTVTTSGAGIHTGGGAFTLHHVTLAHNAGGPGFFGTASEVANSIAWGNDSYPGFVVPPVSASCNIDDGGNAGLNADPLFVAPGAGENYRLQGGSPAIDACATGLSPDLANIARPYGSAYDMGAYEYALGVTLAPDRTGSGASPGGVVYTHTLANTGSAMDTYTLTGLSSNGWSATFAPASSLSLNHGESALITVSLSIPSGVVSGTVDTLVITATSETDPNLTAVVTDTTHTFLPRYTLIVNTTGNGTVDIVPDQPTYLAGATVTLTAVPAADWVFDHWSGDASGTTLTTIITMDSDKTVMAVFNEQPTYMIYLPLTVRNYTP